MVVLDAYADAPVDAGYPDETFGWFGKNQNQTQHVTPVPFSCQAAGRGRYGISVKHEVTVNDQNNIVTDEFTLRMQGALDEAARLADQAVARLDKYAPLRAFALGVLAGADCAASADLDGAVHAARQGMALLGSVGHIDEGEAMLRLTHAFVLDASGDWPAAREAIAVARDVLLAQADKMSDSAWRTSFLERVPENARTLDLAREWCEA